MVAASAGLTQNAVFHIEAGDVNPQLASLQGIAKALRCTVRELMSGRPDGDARFSADLARVARVLESDDPAAVAALQGGLAAAEGLLDRAGRHPSVVTRTRKTKPTTVPLRAAMSNSARVATKAQDGFSARGRKMDVKPGNRRAYSDRSR